MKPSSIFRSLLSVALVAALVAGASTAGASTKVPVTVAPACVLSETEQSVTCDSPAGRVGASCRGIDPSGACGALLAAGTSAAADVVATCTAAGPSCERVDASGGAAGIIVILIGCDVIIISSGSVTALGCDAVIVLL